MDGRATPGHDRIGRSLRITCLEQSDAAISFGRCGRDCCVTALVAMNGRNGTWLVRSKQELAELGITLPRPMPPIANYVPFAVTGKLVVVSGQVPAVDGKIAVTGKVGNGLLKVE